MLFFANRGKKFCSVFPDGIKILAKPDIYKPPNPGVYFGGMVDGKVGGTLIGSDLFFELSSYFKRTGSKPFRESRIRGMRDGKLFRYLINYNHSDNFETAKLNGKLLSPWCKRSRYENIILNSWMFHKRGDEIPVVKPDVEFAWLIFGLSAALWKSCHLKQSLAIRSETDLLQAAHEYVNNIDATPPTNVKEMV